MKYDNNPNLMLKYTIQASRNRVFIAWTEAEELKNWWGPPGWEMHIQKFDLRKRGTCHYKLVSPKGHVTWGRLNYREVKEPEILIFTYFFADAEGNAVRHPDISTWPVKVKNYVTFTDSDKGTTISLMISPIVSTIEEEETFVRAHQKIKEQFQQTFLQLENYLAGA